MTDDEIDSLIRELIIERRRLLREVEQLGTQTIAEKLEVPVDRVKAIAREVKTRRKSIYAVA